MCDICLAIGRRVVSGLTVWPWCATYYPSINCWLVSSRGDYLAVRVENGRIVIGHRSAASPAIKPSRGYILNAQQPQVATFELCDPKSISDATWFARKLIVKDTGILGAIVALGLIVLLLSFLLCCTAVFMFW